MMLFAQTGPYEQAWEALNENKRTEAAELFKKALADKATAEDAYISNMYLASFNGKAGQITDFETAFFNKSKNPYPYTYSLWFNPAVAGVTGKKTASHQLRIIDRLIADKNSPRSLTASANYQRVMHHIFANEFDRTKRFADVIGVIQNWQFTGPFENLAESGFHKDFGPPGNPKPDAVFKSSTNAEVKLY